MRLSTRLMIAMVALVLLTAGTIGFTAYRNILAVSLPRALDNIDSRVTLLAGQLDHAAAVARADLASLHSATGLEELMAGGPDAAMWRERIAARLKAELEAKPAYLEFGIIGVADQGREILRVARDTPGGLVHIVPEAELQAKGDRPYFLHTLTRGSGGIEVFPVALDEEKGKIKVPHVPVLRLTAPLYTAQRRLFGIIIVNVDLRPVFDEIRAAASPASLLYVVNERGDYLVAPDRGREFGFEFGHSYRIQDDFPILAKALNGDDMNAAVMSDKAGMRFGVAAQTVALAGGPRATIVETVPYSRLLAATVAVRNSTLATAIAAALIAILLAFAMARRLTGSLRQMTGAIEAFGRGDTFAAPVGASGEIGMLARAFDQMSAEVRAKTAALEHEVEQRRRIFDTSLDLILITDRKGNYLLVNPASKAILGYEPGEMIGHSATEFIHPDDLESTRAEMRAARRGRIKRTFDCRYMHKDGHAVPLAWAGVWSEAEQKHFFIGRDMTERNRLEQQLRQSQKMDAIGQLTGGVAHDFNNILTVIMSAIDTLSEQVKDTPQLAAVAQLIDDAAERAAELTRRLLAFARRQPLRPRPTDINALVRDTEKLLRPLVGAQIDIEVVLANDVWRAMVDPDHLGTALVNLAVNARDAMPNGGKLTIATRNIVLDEDYAAMQSEVEPGHYALIAVSDTGTGIPAALMDKVFEPFFTTKTPGKGTGLGLSMVYGFVKQSGGHIKLYSEEGHGTTVKIYLPRAPAAEEPQVTGPAAEPVQRGHERILVVEDHPLVRGNLVGQLQSLGYTVSAAASAQEALETLETRGPVDLLLTDVMMPGSLNGRQLADVVSRRWPAIGVLYTSGYTEDAIMHHGRLDPGVRLLTKPYRRSELARMVRISLEARGQTPAVS